MPSTSNLSWTVWQPAEVHKHRNVGERMHSGNCTAFNLGQHVYCGRSTCIYMYLYMYLHQYTLASFFNGEVAGRFCEQETYASEANTREVQCYSTWRCAQNTRQNNLQFFTLPNIAYIYTCMQCLAELTTS